MTAKPESVESVVAELMCDADMVTEGTGIHRDDCRRCRILTAHRVELAEALDALYAVTDDDPCRYDHHGYCQTHGPGAIPCSTAVARDLLRKHGVDK